MAAPSSPLVEKTLAVITGDDLRLLRDPVEQRISETGFIILHEAELNLEELEDAGIDVFDVDEEVDQSVRSLALVLERKGAIKVWKELKGEGAGSLNKKSLAALFPTLRFHASPSTSAATMTISSLFPHLGLASSVDNTPSKSAPSSSQVPFILSNLSHPPPADILDKNKPLSPSVARALQKLELMEGSDKRESMASDSTVTGEDDVEERRVFSYHSRENTLDIGSELDRGDDEVQYAPSTISTTETYTEDLEGEQQYEGEEVYEDEEVGEVLATRPKIAPRTSSVSSLAEPTTQPRLTKAAALRLGIVLPPRQPRTNSDSSSPTKPEQERVVVTPKSLAAPAIVPRSTKASALRDGTGEKNPAIAHVKREAMGTAERNALAAVHKRRESAPVASMAKPRVEVRMTKSAALRAGVELPASSYGGNRMERQTSTTSLTSVSNVSTTTISEEGETSSLTSNPRRQSLSAVKSTAPPKIVPRGTRSSALRSGIDSPIMVRGRSASVLEGVKEEATSEAMARSQTTAGYEGIPGHKRRESIQVASTMKPKIEVRMSKAAALRAGIELPQKAQTAPTTTTDAGVKEKRRESIQVASTARPKIEPRQTKASAMRTGESPAVGKERTSAVPANFEGVPGHRRRESIQVASSRPPTIAPRLNRSTLLRQGSDTALSPTQSRSSSSLGFTRPTPSRTQSTVSTSTAGGGGTIVPRTNKSAELRMKKKASDEEQNSSSSSGTATKVLRKVLSGPNSVVTPSGKALKELSNNGEASPRSSVFATSVSSE